MCVGLVPWLLVPSLTGLPLNNQGGTHNLLGVLCLIYLLMGDQHTHLKDVGNVYDTMGHTPSV